MSKDQRPDHLADSDFGALLLELESPSPHVTLPLTTLTQLKNHLTECEDCRQKLKMQRLERNFKIPLGSGATGARPEGCPAEEMWLKVAGGMAPEDQSKTYIAHAAACRYCGPLLALAQSELLGAPSLSEEKFLGSLSSSTDDWQSQLAARLSAQANDSTGKAPTGTSRPSDRGSRAATRPARELRPNILAPSLLSAAALLLIAAIAGWQIYRLRSQQAPEALIAQAYAERRTLEMRIAGAAHSQVRVERGSGQSSLGRPAALLKAELTIASSLQNNPNDVAILDAKARADLIDGNYAAAIESLERARETQPNSQPLLTDLATAFFIRAESQGQAIDYGQSIEYLTQVLRVSPDDRVALFNRAIAEERVHLYEGAKQDWKHYLEVERDPAWRAEGQERYNSVLKTSLSHAHAGLNAVRDAGSIVAAIHQSNNWMPGNNHPVSGEDEAYLDEAILRWLPSVVANESNSLVPAELAHAGDSPRVDKKTYLEAISVLAKRLVRNHGDPWLKDVFATSHTQDWETGISELALATQANSKGNMPQIAPHAEQAMHLFRKSGNRAGELAALHQYLSGVNRSQMSDRCLVASANSLAQMPRDQYPWVKANILFEVATCDFMAGKPESALNFARQARTVAERSHYPVLMLEADYFLDGVSTPSVARIDSWDRIGRSLGLFWSSDLPWKSALGFYSDLGLAAQAQGMFNCAETIFRESMAMHASDPDQYVVAASHHVLAQAAEAAGDMPVAEKEYSNASERLLHLDRRNGGKRLEFEIERAALEIKLGKLQIASNRLEAIKTNLPPITNHYVNIPYLESLGELHFRFGQYSKSEEELITAVQLIEEDKASLTTETDFLTWQRDSSRAYRALLRLYLKGLREDRKAFALLEWYRAGPVRLIQDRSATKKREVNVLPQQADSFASLTFKATDPSRAPILTWVTFPDSLSLLLWDRNGLHSASVPVSEQLLIATSSRLTRMCRDPQSDRRALDQDAQQLYAWMVEPLAPMLQGVKDLVIEPDDALGQIPYQAFERKDGKYLGDMLAIVESPGMGYARLLRKERAITPRAALLAVGNPLLSASMGESYRPLPDATKEAVSIAARFDHPYLMTGRQANLDQVRQVLNKVEIFHFAGHSFAGGVQSGLILAAGTASTGNVSLGLEQLPREKLSQLQLVVLSGCETGVAEQGLVDPQSLVRIFLRAGVPNVVASKWNVDSRASQILMDSLYSHLLHGERVSQAVTAAERSLRADPATSHPYYWAAFSAFGS